MRARESERDRETTQTMLVLGNTVLSIHVCSMLGGWGWGWGWVGNWFRPL